MITIITLVIGNIKIKILRKLSDKFQNTFNLLSPLSLMQNIILSIASTYTLLSSAGSFSNFTNKFLKFENLFPNNISSFSPQITFQVFPRGLLTKEEN